MPDENIQNVRQLYFWLDLNYTKQTYTYQIVRWYSGTPDTVAMYLLCENATEMYSSCAPPTSKKWHAGVMLCEESIITADILVRNLTNY